jgi:hypothetical protein
LEVPLEPRRRLTAEQAKQKEAKEMQVTNALAPFDSL